MKLDELLTEEFDETAKLKRMSLKDQIKHIQQRPSDFWYILQYDKNPPDALKLAAVSAAGGWIEHIQNPTPEMLNIALTEPVFINSRLYDKFVKGYFKNNTVLMNKWLRYAANVRDLE